MAERKGTMQSSSSEPSLDPELCIPYAKLRELLPKIPEDQWLELKDIALDNDMKKLLDFIDQLKRQKQLDPDFVIKIGALITTLEYLIAIFKIQRSIIEELKQAVSKR